MNIQEKKQRVCADLKNLAERLGWNFLTMYVEDETAETFIAEFYLCLEEEIVTDITMAIDCKDIPCIDGITIRIPIEKGNLSQCKNFKYEGYLELERLPGILINENNLTKLSDQFTRYLKGPYIYD